MDDVRVSKLLSLVLRHAPERIGIVLDPQGWTSVPQLLAALERSGRPVTRAQLERVVAGDDGQRFTLETGASGTGTDRVRADQGHSVPVDLGLAPVDPPPVLFHGTPERNVAAILREGLHRGARHHVHLSPDVATARRVGARRGRPAVLLVDAARMAADGHVFHRSANGVWLTGAVPAGYLGRHP